MDKKYLVKFLNGKKRGAYDLLVEAYSEVACAMGPTMALDIIKEELEKETRETLRINYNSFARAVLKYKNKSKKALKSGGRKLEFKDANETVESQVRPGKFTLD